ncbi:hypothetical protein JYT71_01570, partial [Acidimicrobiaceae bacterium AH-315-P05]|nr:hypothetical protein [Acidimicrobiaceae bacterium AH-315-P05]
ADLNIGFHLDDGQLTVMINDTPDWETFIFVGQGGTDARFWKFGIDEDRAFNGGALLEFTPDGERNGPFLKTEDTLLVLEGLMVEAEAGNDLVVALPGGVTQDGTVIESVPGPLIDITIFVEKDGLQGIIYYDALVAFRELFQSQK